MATSQSCGQSTTIVDMVAPDDVERCGDTAPRPKTPPPRATVALRADCDAGLRRSTDSESERRVSTQTEGILRHFIAEMNSRRGQCSGSVSECSQAASSSSSSSSSCQSPDVDAAAAGHNVDDDELLSVEERVGRQLAVIGDEVDVQYASVFSKMIDTLSVDDNTPYDNFATVARQLFSDGLINWGRIIVLLCFGYRVIVAAMKRGLRFILAQLVEFVLQFFVRENIAGWVATQGGWVSALRYVPESIGWQTLPTTVGVVLGVAAVCVAAAVFIIRQ